MNPGHEPTGRALLSTKAALAELSVHMTNPSMRLIFLLAAFHFATVHTARAEDWFSRYYEHPAPERFVAEVHLLSKAGRLSNPETSALTSVFLGRVMASNPSQVDGWLSQLGDLKGGDRRAVLLAASLSGTEEAQAYLRRQADAEEYRGKPIDIRAIEPDNAMLLDMLWADFFATGDAAPIRRIVVALNYDKYSGALDRFAKSEKTDKDRNEAILDSVFKVAMWSLKSNAEQHRRVGDILEQLYFSDGITRSEQVWLSAILAKVMPDKYELTRSDSGHWTLKGKSVPGR